MVRVEVPCWSIFRKTQGLVPLAQPGWVWDPLGLGPVGSPGRVKRNEASQRDESLFSGSKMRQTKDSTRAFSDSV